MTIFGSLTDAACYSNYDQRKTSEFRGSITIEINAHEKTELKNTS